MLSGFYDGMIKTLRIINIGKIDVIKMLANK